MKNFKIKALTLSIALGLGSTQALAFSFAETVEPSMGSVPADEYMNKTAEPIKNSPVSTQSDTDLQEKMKQKAAEKEQAELDLQERMRQKAAEKERAEREAQASLEQRMREKARQKAEEERQARIAKERAEREAKRADAQKLIDMRNEGIRMIGDLDLVQMKDRLKYKAHYDEMVRLAGGDKQNQHVKDMGITGARKYFNDAWPYLQEHGQYIFDSVEQGKQWGYAWNTDISKGEYVKILKDWPERIEATQTMLDLATKYANIDGDIAEIAKFQKYLDWRKEELQARLDQVQALQEDPEFNPDEKINKGLTLGGIGKVKVFNDVTVGDVGSAAADAGKKGWEATKNVSGKAVDGVKKLFSW